MICPEREFPSDSTRPENALGLVCMGLAGLSGHGNIGPWGAWIGFGGVFALLLATFVVGGSGKNNGRHGNLT
jgi:hypothetical protein